MNIKMSVRNTVSIILSLIPLNFLYGVRSRQFSQGLVSQISSLIISKFLRYRKIDASIKEFELPDCQDLKFHNDGSYISRQLFWQGMHGYEFPEAKFWRYLCSSENV